MPKNKSKPINTKKNFELALIITAVTIGVVAASTYANNPIVLHQIPLLNLIP